MRKPASKTRATTFEIFKWTLLGLVACAALTVRAQTARQQMPRLCRYDDSDNTYQASPFLPADLLRVAVLPVACDESQAGSSYGSDTLGPVLLSELARTEKFEVVSVRPQDLLSRTGRLSWNGDEVMPADFLGSLQRVYGCDAVLFCQMSVFRAYPPLAVGWRMKLVDVRSGRIIWAVDRVFEAKPRSSFSLAWHDHIGSVFGLFQDSSNDWRAENSPRLFGQCAIAEALSSLPNRKK